MKATTPKILLVLLFVSGIATAQITVKEFYTKDDNRTDAEHAFYYRVGEKGLVKRGEIGSKWFDTVYVDSVKTFYVSTNTIRSRSFYEDGIQEGPYKFYHENGRLKEEGVSSGVLKIGTVKYWTDQGIIQKELFFLDYSKRKEGKEIYKIVNYWNGTTQLVKDGQGHCQCYLNEDGALEEGKVTDGYRDLTWKITSGDTLTAVEIYKEGILKKGEAKYKGKIIVYNEVYTQAIIHGGYNALVKFLAKNIKYPSRARDSRVSGKVYVKFIVDVNGDISSISILRGADHDLNKEAMRVVGLMDPWIPAQSRGIPVKSTFILPVSFKIEL